jgi:hypothetical protein
MGEKLSLHLAARLAFLSAYCRRTDMDGMAVLPWQYLATLKRQLRTPLRTLLLELISRGAASPMVMSTPLNDQPEFDRRSAWNCCIDHPGRLLLSPVKMTPSMGLDVSSTSTNCCGETSIDCCVGKGH